MDPYSGSVLSHNRAVCGIKSELSPSRSFGKNLFVKCEISAVQLGLFSLVIFGDVDLRPGNLVVDLSRVLGIRRAGERRLAEGIDFCLCQCRRAASVNLLKIIALYRHHVFILFTVRYADFDGHKTVR